MTGRLAYEVRLRKTTSLKQWRWDVNYLKTTDPEHPGVETGRYVLGSDWGYEKFKWQAVRQITKRLLKNKYKEIYVEV